jgi:hypothetical protein
MLNQTPKNFRQFFLLEFTKELIRNTGTYREFIIKREVRKVLHEELIKKELLQRDLAEREMLRGAVKEKIKKESERISQLKKEEIKEILPEFKKYYSFKPAKRGTIKPAAAPLSYTIPIPYPAKISEISEPIIQEIQYFRPTPTQRNIDLGKLNPLINDSLVKVIECDGPGEKILVIGGMGRKNTRITLSREEIDDIINRFSEAAKIPVHEGVFKVVFGMLIFSAVVSKIVGSKFIIKKMPEFA